MTIRTIGRAVVGAALCLLASCVSAKRAITPATEIVDMPGLGIASTAELGNTLLAKGKIATCDAIFLKEQAVAGGGQGIVSLIVEPQTLLAGIEDDKWIYFFANRVIQRWNTGDRLTMGGLKLSKQDRRTLQAFNEIVEGLPMSNLPRFDLGKSQALGTPSFKQELIYNGRSGDTIRVLYREIAGDIMRAPFTQEAQYDLKDGNTIGFKGARIEVLEASNTSLSYKVLESFPSPGGS